MLYHAGMAHDHDHAQDHAHGHAIDIAGNEKRLLLAMAITGVFMVAEVVGGILSGSLALLADAAHMFTDSASLALAWLAFRVSRRPQDKHRSYGYHRFQVLAAFVNAVSLIAIAVWIVVEAVNRLVNPIEVQGGTMIVIATLGLLANLAVLAILHTGDRDNLNIRGAALHVMGDLLSSVAAIAAAGVILATGWTPIDPILSMLVMVIILRSAWPLMRKSAHILLEGTPEWLDVGELRAGLIAAVPEVEDVHHVHAWSLTAERPLLTLHAMVKDGSDQSRALERIKAFLQDEYAIDHSTVQIEAGECADDELPGGAVATGE